MKPGEQNKSPILIVEDQQDVQKLLAVALQRYDRPILHAL